MEMDCSCPWHDAIGRSRPAKKSMKLNSGLRISNSVNSVGLALMAI
jgi:hypothetical protein